MKSFKERINWILEQHEKCNHKYDGYIPYKFHLDMVVNVFNKFKHLVENFREDQILFACYGHDLLEDTRTTYQEVLNNLGFEVAELIYAVTREKGRNRGESANENYFEGIRKYKYATFVKMCDRIANVEYAKMTGNVLFNTYKKENEKFIKDLKINKHHMCYPMMQYLNKLFN